VNQRNQKRADADEEAEHPPTLSGGIQKVNDTISKQEILGWK
jgi:hypothetical protein